ncbi:MAG: MBL fold metallo-hydrolase [Chloroflexota bacterium]|nr:MBL fold metallo-hydrolase [Chloroflexota bacterium]
MQIGQLTVTAILDGVARMEPTRAYRDSMPEQWAIHRRFLDKDGLLELALGGFLVRGAGDRVVLVDNGVGENSRGLFQGGALLENLAKQGVAPADVTDVVFTHLHFDHVGWTTREGQIVFPNAVFRCDARDWAHFLGDTPDPRVGPVLAPVEQRLESWAGSGPLLPGIDTMAAPGHTPGSTILVLSSGTARGLLLGDVVHCPVELLDDEWGGMGDVDPDLARRTRIALAKEIEGSDVPVAPSHFPGMVFGRLLLGEGQRSWVVG